VEVLRDRTESDGDRRRRLQLQLRDGTVLDVSRAGDADVWRIDRERDD
jgi:hypothetical protein